MPVLKIEISDTKVSVTPYARSFPHFPSAYEIFGPVVSSSNMLMNFGQPFRGHMPVCPSLRSSAVVRFQLTSRHKTCPVCVGVLGEKSTKDKFPNFFFAKFWSIREDVERTQGDVP